MVVIGTSDKRLKTGTVNLGAAGSSVVTFATPFRVGAVVRVFVTPQFNNADTSCTYSAHTISRTGFTLQGAGNPAGNVAWLALDVDGD